MTVAITPTQRKYRGYLTLDQKFKKNLKNVDKDITFISGKDLQILLCQDKPKLLPNSHPGVYQLDCSCSGKYICESKKKILKGCIEHQQDSIKVTGSHPAPLNTPNSWKSLFRKIENH